MVKSVHWGLPTFTHVTEGVLVGFIGAYATWHVWCVHARLVGRVGGHVLPEKCRVAAIREGVLQTETDPRREGRKS